MRIGLVCLAVLMATPLPAMAEVAPAAAPATAPKIKKICRESPPKTGSNRPGKRVCKTAEEWRAYDQADADFDGTTKSSKN